MSQMAALSFTRSAPGANLNRGSGSAESRGTSGGGGSTAAEERGIIAERLETLQVLLMVL